MARVKRLGSVGGPGGGGVRGGGGEVGLQTSTEEEETRRRPFAEAALRQDPPTRIQSPKSCPVSVRSCPTGGTKHTVAMGADRL